MSRNGTGHGQGLVSRAPAHATAAERGDYRFDEDPEPVIPDELQHSVAIREPSDGPAFSQCRHCKLSRSIGSINPFERCPARERSSPIDARADAAEADEYQETFDTLKNGYVRSVQNNLKM